MSTRLIARIAKYAVQRVQQAQRTADDDGFSWRVSWKAVAVGTGVNSDAPVLTSNGSERLEHAEVSSLVLEMSDNSSIGQGPLGGCPPMPSSEARTALKAAKFLCSAPDAIERLSLSRLQALIRVGPLRMRACPDNCVVCTGRHTHCQAALQLHAHLYPVPQKCSADSEAHIGITGSA